MLLLSVRMIYKYVLSSDLYFLCHQLNSYCELITYSIMDNFYALNKFHKIILFTNPTAISFVYSTQLPPCSREKYTPQPLIASAYTKNLIIFIVNTIQMDNWLLGHLLHHIFTICITSHCSDWAGVVFSPSYWACSVWTPSTSSSASWYFPWIGGFGALRRGPRDCNHPVYQRICDCQHDWYVICTTIIGTIGFELLDIGTLVPKSNFTTFCVCFWFIPFLDFERGEIFRKIPISPLPTDVAIFSNITKIALDSRSKVPNKRSVVCLKNIFKGPVHHWFWNKDDS